ncbi:hypothetical protein BC830DRAFT_1045643, partial [Chytriomyces sp. MP71]
VLASVSVNFERDLPRFKTIAGAIHVSETEVVAPTLMFAAALDTVLAQLSAILDLSRVVAIGGCGQQHGPVFWKKGAGDLLSRLGEHVDESLEDLLSKGAFAIHQPPIWMDSDSTEYCHRLERDVGGPQALADLTGSHSYERFTGNLIAKIIDTHRDEFAVCERISLISSFIPSLLLGTYAPIDYTDGSGMNLLDLDTKQWHPTLLDSIAGPRHTPSHIASLLGTPSPTLTSLGPISPYFTRRYKLPATCLITPFMGDNPSTVAGRALVPGHMAVTLGTSGGLMALLPRALARPSGREGHLLLDALAPRDTRVVMLCFKNGSLVREEVRNRVACRSWDVFGRLLRGRVVGNQGYIGIFYGSPEITPPCPRTGMWVFDVEGRRVLEGVPPEVEVRCVVESQVMAMRRHAEMLGVVNSQRIVVSGGAAANVDILQVVADVFGVPVVGGGNGAELGAA